MREVRIDSLKLGEPLSGTVYCDFAYNVFLAKGTILKQEHLDRLHRANPHGLCYIVNEDVLAGLRLDLLEQLDNPQVKRAYLDLYVVGRSLMESMERGNPFNLKLVQDAAGFLVDQMMDNTMLLLQLASVRAIDDYTFSHMVNSALYAAAFGRCLNLPKKDIRDLCLAGLLHDIGKVQIPAEILCKPDKLTPEEFAEMKKHPKYAYEKLKCFAEIDEQIRQAALQHHERGDGSGYPDGRKTGEISTFARIIAIVDVYDALTSDRCYRRRVLPHESAEVLMGDCAYDRFDIELVRTFLRFIALYPLGTEVMLNDGRRARVKHINADFPLRPTLELLRPAAGGKLLPAGDVDLCKHPTLFINKVLI